MHITDLDSLKKVFDDFDVDSSGAIDKNELENALRRAKKNPTKDQLQDLIETFDTDNSGKLDFDEFRKMCGTLE